MVGLLEFVSYLWERNTAQDSLGWTLVGSRRMPIERHGSDESPYYLFVPERDYTFEGVPVHINSQGIRDDRVTEPKPDDYFRILNVGDSVPFGWEVNLEDSYGKQLEAMLNEQGTGQQYEVINAAVPGWNIKMARSFLEQEGLEYEPDAIVLAITLVNDVYGKGPNVSENEGLLGWLRDHTYSWPFLTTQIRFLLARQVGPEAIPVLNPPQNADAYFPQQETDPKWDEFWQDIHNIKVLADSKGIPLVVVAFPTAFQLSSSNHPDVAQRVLATRSDSENIDFIDLLPIYQDVCNGAEPEACEGYENMLFADVWMHPNELGHELAAEVILKANSYPNI